MHLNTMSALVVISTLLVSCTKQRDEPATFSSFDPVDRSSEQPFAAGAIKFEQADLSRALNLYQEISRRTVIRAGNLPDAKITLRNETPWTRVEALRALDTALAQNNVTMILLGSRFVKAVPAREAASESAPVIDLRAEQLPDSSSYIIYIVKLEHRRSVEVSPVLQPFAKMSNSIVAMKDSPILILRDYSANVRRMLEVLKHVEAADDGAVQRMIDAIKPGANDPKAKPNR